jgi:SagB-type dehydrogenase family enzyme
MHPERPERLVAARAGLKRAVAPDELVRVAARKPVDQQAIAASWRFSLGGLVRYMINPARQLVVVVGAMVLLAAIGAVSSAQSAAKRVSNEQGIGSVMKLPAPRKTHGLSLEEAIERRRSVREFSDVALTDAEHGQLLWAAQGVTHRRMGLRAAPSAGALYPLEAYLVTGSGVFHYEPRAHQLRQTVSGDVRKALSDAALRQEAVRDAPAVIVLAGVYERTAKKYGARAERYVLMEAGHAAQNLLLQAVSLGLAAVPIGALDDDEVQRSLNLPKNHRPLYLLPVGHPAR